MFLALTDAGKERDLQEIARALLRLVDRHLPETKEAREARRFWREGLKDPDSTQPGKELADRVYLVMLSVGQAFERNDGPWSPRTGDMVVCDVIRRRVPLAPGGFTKVGKIEGTSSEPPEAVRWWPNRSHAWV